MKQDTLAPWAEPVSDAPFPMTTDEMLALPDDGWMYELVEGRLVRMPTGGGEASVIATNLVTEIGLFLRTQKLGRITGADGTYDLTQPGDTYETALVPDVAFVRMDRLPERTSPEFAKAWQLAPDLVAEIVSPSQYRPEMAAKAKRYLEAGVRLVWIIWPKYQQVDVWQSGAEEPVATLKPGDALDGLDVLPGFMYPLSDLFE